MILFLTSSPTGPLDGSYQVEGLDPKNHLIDHLKKYWKEDARCLMITAFPSQIEESEQMTAFFRDAFRKSGFSLSGMDLWDDRTGKPSADALRVYDVILLGGGHVPTQNAFFARLGLRELFAGYDGIVIGISAGSMNSADLVYAQPELSGEAVDPAYQRYLPGLGLTGLQILPHYQMAKDNFLDGMRLYEEITYGDSFGHAFLSIPDGSYVLSEQGQESVWGEAAWIRDGKRTPFCQEGEHRKLED